tara:strand:+ start:43261 stop:43917 length:657 start_codon:yes stop_codon:yes gene_type:complete
MFAFIFIFSISLNVYFLTTSTAYVETVSDDFNDYQARPQVIKEDSLSISQASIKKNTECPPAQKVDEVKENFLYPEGKKTEDNEVEDKDEFAFDEEEYQRASKEFYQNANKSIAEFLEYKVGLNYEQVDEYYNLKDKRQKEIDDFINERFAEMKENGAKHLVLSMEDTIEMGKINQKYLDKLKKNIGMDAYERYQDFKQNLNNKAQSGQNYYGFYIDF